MGMQSLSVSYQPQHTPEEINIFLNHVPGMKYGKDFTVEQMKVDYCRKKKPAGRPILLKDFKKVKPA